MGSVGGSGVGEEISGVDDGVGEISCEGVGEGCVDSDEVGWGVGEAVPTDSLGETPGTLAI